MKNPLHPHSLLDSSPLNTPVMEANPYFSTDLSSTLINYIPDPVFVKDEHHCWVYLNDAYCDFMGYSREELLGKSDYDFFPEKEATIFWEKDQLVFDTGKTNKNHESFTNSKGKTHHISTKKSLIVDNKGQKFLIGIIRDISTLEVNKQALETKIQQRTQKLEQQNIQLKDTQKDLAEQKAKIRSVLDSTEDYIFAINKEYRLIEYNKKLANSALKIFDLQLAIDFYMLPNIIPPELEQNTPKKTIASYWKPLYDRALNGESFAIEQHFRFKNDDYYFLTNFTPIKNESGEIIGCTVYAKNITNRQKINIAINQVFQSITMSNHESFFDSFVTSIAQALHVPYVIIGQISSKSQSIQTKAVWMCDKVVQQLIYPLKNTPCELLVTHKKIHCFDGNLAANFPELGALESWSVKSYLGIPLFNAEEEIIGTLSILDTKAFQNLKLAKKLLQLYSTRVAAELERFRAAQERQTLYYQQQTILDSLPAIFYLKDTNNNILKCNKIAAELMGSTVKEIEGTPTSVHFPEYAERYYADDLKVILSGKPSWGILEPYRTPNKTYWVRTDKTPYKDELGNITGVLVYATDISDLKQTQLRLEEKNKKLQAYIDSNSALELVAHNVAHDLKEPIRTMKSFAQLLNKKLAHTITEEIQEYLDFIINGAVEMNALIQSVLDYAKVDTEKKTSETIYLNKELAHTVHTLNDVLKETNGKVQLLNIPTNIIGNRIRIKQLFQNLIVNSLKFHQKDISPIIKIEGKESNTHWRFRVQDNGIGVPPEHQEEIFAPFRKLHTKGEFAGTGFGLALCKRIVEQHGGEIRVCKETTQGCCIIFDLAKKSS